MKIIRLGLPVLLAFLFLQGPLQGADNIFDQIRDQAFNHSKVLDTAFYLSDVYGPRFTASPQAEQTADWATQQLHAIGIPVVKQEVIGPIGEQGFHWSGRGWSYSHSYAAMLQPQYLPLMAIPIPYSSSTRGRVHGQPIRVDLPPPTGPELDRFIQRYEGKLRGKVLLVSKASQVAFKEESMFHRLSDQELASLQKSTEHTQSSNNPAHPSGTSPRTQARTSLMGVWSNYNRLFKFLHQQGVVALMYGAAGEAGSMQAVSPPGVLDQNPMVPPAFAIMSAQYDRILRLCDRNIPVTIELELKSRLTASQRLVNVVAELPGHEKASEVVMVGAHLDSLYGGTGAADNAAGVAIVMEAIRILKAANLPMARTVRVAFWIAEEMGTRGSKDYVEKHANELKQIVYYVNLDHGGGKIRGAFVSREASSDEVKNWLKPVKDLGAITVSTQMPLSSDHRNFIAAGVPSLDLLQDPLHYETLTHHSNLDVYDYLSEDDLKQASAVVASLLYQAAQPSTQSQKAENGKGSK